MTRRPRPSYPRPERAPDAVSEAQIEAMRIKLAQRCAITAGGSVMSPAVPQATVTAGGGKSKPVLDVQVGPLSARPAPLQWERVGSYVMRTSDRVWSCCKVFLDGKPSYELWRHIAGVERPVCVKRALESFEQAREIAQSEMDTELNVD